MKYNLDWLINESQSRREINYLFFWGHQPNKDGTIGKSCLSQWWESDFEMDSVTYKTAEHYMMAEKARLFEDEAILHKILIAKSPAEAKELGRQVKNFQPKVWEEIRYDIVKKGNLYKFGQNPDLKTYLLNTKNQVLVEASPVDTIWGIGMAKDNPAAAQPEQWKGLNLLGFALMEVRDELNIHLHPAFSIQY